jgi:hypothetical protein
VTVPLLAFALPAASSIELVGLGLTAVVTAISLVAMHRVCGRDRRRRATLDVFSRAVQVELAESGYRALFASPILFCLIVLLLLREGGGMLPGLIGGGVLGLLTALGVPDQAVAWLRPDFVKKMDPAMRRLHQEFRRRRSVAAVVAAVAPLFLAAVVTAQRLEVGYAHEPEQAASIGFLLGAVQIAALAWGVQCLQVLRSLNRIAPVRETERVGPARWRANKASRSVMGDQATAAWRRVARGWKTLTGSPDARGVDGPR